MKKFSRFDLLNNVVLSPTGDIINRMFDSKYARLDIWVPQYDLKRAQVFVSTVNDLLDNEDEDIELFSIDKFIILLYEDFLRQIDYGMTLETLGNAIRNKLNELEVRNIKVTHYHDNQENKIELNDIVRHMNQKKEIQRMNQERLISFRILKKYVLRGEVLLHDLSELHPDIHLTVEELICLRFRDVLNQIKKGDYSILANIVNALSD